MDNGWLDGWMRKQYHLTPRHLTLSTDEDHQKKPLKNLVNGPCVKSLHIAHLSPCLLSDIIWGHQWKQKKYVVYSTKENINPPNQRVHYYFSVNTVMWPTGTHKTHQPVSSILHEPDEPGVAESGWWIVGNGALWGRKRGRIWGSIPSGSMAQWLP